jgi:HSP90 family molecular chaperone
MPKGGDLYFTLVPDHKHIQLYIKDTGVGMDSERFTCSESIPTPVSFIYN